jgi:uncharacterized short protein YbdD (DUF466 family)
MSGTSFKAAKPQLQRFFSEGLSLLRGVTGDDAYEKYLRHMQTTETETTPLSARAFFQAQMERKWSCVNGCC